MENNIPKRNIHFKPEVAEGFAEGVKDEAKRPVPVLDRPLLFFERNGCGHLGRTVSSSVFAVDAVMFTVKSLKFFEESSSDSTCALPL